MPTQEQILLPRKGETVPIHLRLWLPEGQPRAVLQLTHGMAEHIDRYDEAARTLSEAGFAVLGHSHRGHGPEWPDERLGHFADRDGWDALIDDMRLVMDTGRQRFPETPYVLMGHSMGSFAAREFALRYGGDLDGLVLSGTGWYGALKCTAGAALAALFPNDRPAPLLDKLLFGANNRKFAPNRTPSDWLTRDEQAVDAYIADDRCGFPFTGGSYKSFFRGLRRLADTSRLTAMPAALPVYFFSGDHDPVGQMGKGVRRVAEDFRRAGMNDVTVRLYPGGRHEMLNELNRAEVVRDLTVWLEEHYAE